VRFRPHVPLSAWTGLSLRGFNAALSDSSEERMVVIIQQTKKENDDEDVWILYC